MPEDQTVPVFAAREGVPLDWLRKLLRRRPDLQQLLRHAGPTRVVPAGNLDTLRDAVREAKAGTEAVR